MTITFFIGLHQPSDAHRFARSCISINRLRTRKKPIAGRILIDSGAFTELSRHGRYRHSPADYAAQLARLHGILTIEAAVAQDYMCEPFMLAKTGLTVEDHQRLTIERYDALLDAQPPCFIMPVLQGYQPAEYVDHLRAYGERLTPGMWVGVGSVCKRNGEPERIVEVLHAILTVRPDLRLHGFGVKKTALQHPGVRSMLATADSLAWSYAARIEGRSPNDWREAMAFNDAFEAVSATAVQPWQMPLL